MLPGEILLKERFRTSNLAKSSSFRGGTDFIILYYRLTSDKALRFLSCSSLTLLSERSIELRF